MRFLVDIAIALILIYCLFRAFLSPFRRRKRTKALSQIAAELAFHFSSTGNSAYFEGLSEFGLFSRGSHRVCFNAMIGDSDKSVVKVFDYRYFVRSIDGGGECHLQTVICIQFAGKKLPLFSLHPKTFIHTWLGSNGITFNAYPCFSSSYLLFGPNEDEIRQLFTPQVLDFFEQHFELAFEGAGNQIICYKPNDLIKPEQIRDFLKQGFEVLRLCRP